ncbi:MAG: hypothetical protein Q9172_006170 [Xanthocarpia lactea]
MDPSAFPSPRRCEFAFDSLVGLSQFFRHPSQPPDPLKPKRNLSSKNKEDIATMRFIIASIALFVALTVALPHELPRRQVSVEEAAMTVNGQVVPFDTAGVTA